MSKPQICRVVKVEGNTVTLRRAGADCAGCDGCATFGCMGDESRAAKNRVDFFTAEKPEDLTLAPGDEVGVEFGSSFASGFLALAVPAAGFAAGLIAAGPLAGVAGLFVAAAAFYLYAKKHPRPGSIKLYRAG